MTEPDVALPGTLTTASSSTEPGNNNDEVITRARSIISRICVSNGRPDVSSLHELSHLIESEEMKYLKHVGFVKVNTRSANLIGRLSNLLKDNDEMYDLVTSRLLLEAGHPIPMRAAAARLFLACLNSLVFRSDLDEELFVKLKSWVQVSDTSAQGTSEEPFEREMLRTYATGLLAYAIAGDDSVDEVVRAGIISQLTHYLRKQCCVAPCRATPVKGKTPAKTPRDQPTEGKRRRARDDDAGPSHRPDQDRKERAVMGEDALGSLKAPAPSKAPEADGAAILPEEQQDGGLVSQDAGDRTAMDGEEAPEEVAVVMALAGAKVWYDEAEYTVPETIGGVDISKVVMAAMKAAEAEARCANAPPHILETAAEAAGDAVRGAASEAHQQNKTESEILKCAWEAADAVANAAQVVVSKNKIEGASDRSQGSAAAAMPAEDHSLDYLSWGVSRESLTYLRELYSLSCLIPVGEYMESLGPILQERGVEMCLEFLKQRDILLVSTALDVVCSLMAHRKFGTMFVDGGGVQLLLNIPFEPWAFSGVSVCLFGLASLQGVMDRVCTLQPPIIHRLVTLGLQLLSCNQDAARKHAALFFGSAFAYPVMVAEFDSQSGMEILTSALKTTSRPRPVEQPPHGMGVARMFSWFTNLDNHPRSLPPVAADVLTATGRQVISHSCMAVRQYFRVQLLLQVDSLKSGKSPSKIVGTRPLDNSAEAVESVITELQKDRKLGPLFVRAKWAALERFHDLGGIHMLLELMQTPLGDRAYGDSCTYALSTLRMATLMPFTHKTLMSAQLSNERTGMAALLDAASDSAFTDPEVMADALNVLCNLLWPPPSLCKSGAGGAQVRTQGPSNHGTSGSQPTPETPRHPEQQQQARRETVRQPKLAPNSDLKAPMSATQSRDRAAAEGPSSLQEAERRPFQDGNGMDFKISLGVGGIGAATCLEQGYRMARDAVRACNGIKTLLHLLDVKTLVPPSHSDYIRLLACRALLGLAKDPVIAQILTKLQVGSTLSDLLRETGGGVSVALHGATAGNEKWQAELQRTALDLISVTTNAGTPSAAAASEAAAPTLRRIERAAIAAATNIVFNPIELLQLIHAHLLSVGLSGTARSLLTEAQIVPLDTTNSFSTPVPAGSHGRPAFLLDNSPRQQQQAPVGVLTAADSAARMDWPSHRTGSGFMTASGRLDGREAHSRTLLASRRKVAAGSRGLRVLHASKIDLKEETMAAGMEENSSARKRKHAAEPLTPVPKKMNTGEGAPADLSFVSPPVGPTSHHREADICTPTHDMKLNPSGSDSAATASLDSIVTSWLKQQHRQCPTPITTLPPLSLLHAHVCPEPRRFLDASHNLTGRLEARQINPPRGGRNGRKYDKQLVFSRFKSTRSCREEGGLITSAVLLNDASRVVAGTTEGDIRIFDVQSGAFLDGANLHEQPIVHLQVAHRPNSAEFLEASQLLLSSARNQVCLWDMSELSHPCSKFDNCRSGKFNNSLTRVACIGTERPGRDILLFDISSGSLLHKLEDFSGGLLRNQWLSGIHFSPMDDLLLWNGNLWDPRIPTAVHRFDQFTDYGGGGFHPSGNEVIINSEVWDLRTRRLLRSVPSLDQTTILFNLTGDVIYATQRRMSDEILAALHGKRRRNPLYSSFRTLDAVEYVDIATFPVDRCVVDLAIEPSDSYVAVVALEESDEIESVVRLYEVGRRKPLSDDSDPDDLEDSDREDSEVDGMGDSDGEGGIHFDGEDMADDVDLERDGEGVRDELAGMDSADDELEMWAEEHDLFDSTGNDDEDEDDDEDDDDDDSSVSYSEDSEDIFNMLP